MKKAKGRPCRSSGDMKKANEYAKKAEERHAEGQGET